MNQYSIKDLEKLSGIKAHTIRIWERRYQTLSPKRTDTNIRYYTDVDVKRIMNFGLLNKHGFKISSVAKMSDEELKETVASILNSSNGHTAYINQFLGAMLDLDENHFHQTFVEAETQFGFEETVVEIFYPLLNKIGVMWRVDKVSPAQEHFISNLVRNKLIAGIDTLQLNDESYNEQKVVMYLPEHEMHELGLLFYYYIAKKQGNKVFFLGQRTPTVDLIDILKELNPALLVSSWVLIREQQEIDQHFAEIRSTFPLLKIFVGGNVSNESSEYTKIESAIQLKKVLES